MTTSSALLPFSNGNGNVKAEKKQLEADLAAVESLISRITQLEDRGAAATINNSNVEEIQSGQSSSHGAEEGGGGAGGGKPLSDVAFTKERSAVGARMTVASSSSDIRAAGHKREADGGAALSKKPKLSQEEGDEDGDAENASNHTMSTTLHSSEEASSQRREDEFDHHREAWEKSLAILDDLTRANADAWVFGEPVQKLWPDSAANYEKHIKNPMDLGTVRRRVSSRYYSSPFDFASDVRLTFENAMTYNMKGSVYHKLAKMLLQKFNTGFKAVDRILKANSKFRRSKSGATRLVAAPAAAVSPVAEISLKMDSSPPEFEFQFQPQQQQIEEPLPPPPPRSQSSQPRPRRSRSPDPDPAPPVSGPGDSCVHDPEPQVQPQPLPMLSPVVRDKFTKPARLNVGKLNPRLGRQTSSSAYGGIRPLTPKEKAKLSELVDSFPLDRMNKVVDILKERSPHLLNENADVELDLDNLDEETQFTIYRLAMNWQKSKNKVLSKKMLIGGDHEAAGVLQQADSSDNVDVVGGMDSPIRDPAKEEKEEESSSDDDSDESSDSESGSDDDDGSSGDSSSGKESGEGEADVVAETSEKG